MPYNDLIDKHANRVGIDPSWMHKIMRIESGGNPNNITGSYKGLFQLSEKEFKRHGGSGSILDPEQNTMAAANKLAQERLTFKQKYGRDPTLGDLYMIHQQGEGGAAAHAANPDRPAWENMASTAEGRKKGAAWAKKAIWGNIPDSEKAKFGSVENVTSKQFTDMWSHRVETLSAAEHTRAGGGKTPWKRSGAEPKPETSEVESRASEPTRKSVGWDPIPTPESPHFGKLVPDIRLPQMPRGV